MKAPHGHHVDNNLLKVSLTIAWGHGIQFKRNITRNIDSTVVLDSIFDCDLIVAANAAI